MKQPLQKLYLLLIISVVLGLINVRTGKSASLFSPYIEKKAIGWIDWDKGYIYGIGRGYLKNNGGSTRRAIGAASLVASGNIVKLAADLNVDDKKTLKEVGSGKVVIQLKAFLRDQEYSKELIQGVDSYYEIVNKAPLYGVSGITAKLISQMGEGPAHVLPAPQRGSEDSASDEDNLLPWVVLDARKLTGSQAVAPAFFPKIMSERGTAVYQMSDADRQTLSSRGMVRYVSSLASTDQIEQYSLPPLLGILQLFRKIQFVQDAYAADTNRVRHKRQQYIVMDVKNTQGLKNTNLVVSEADANRLRADDNVTKILQKCRVVVLVSGNVGGVEGRLGQKAFYATLTQ